MPTNFVDSKNSKQLYEVNIKNILASLNDAYVFWKDKKSNFLGCNKKFLASTGCGSSQDFIKTNDYDMPWANAFADIYVEDDRNIIDTGIPKINYKQLQQQLDGTTKTILVSKIPLYGSKGEINGLLGFYTDISSEEVIVNIGLTKRQSQCLYHLVRGKTAKQIAKALNLSNRTVEFYLENIKDKFKCESRSDLIAKAIEMGFGNI